MIDKSNGYDGIAKTYMQARSGIGATTVAAWAGTFEKGALVLDLGCGHGIPVTKMLLDAGLHPYAINASPNMITAFRQNFPDIPVACEPVEQSSFFHLTFDGIIAIGLLFLLDDQQAFIRKMASALNAGGRLLFTAPLEKVIWEDVLTRQSSASLGAAAYRELLLASGLTLCEEYEDEGGNHYYSAIKKASTL